MEELLGTHSVKKLASTTALRAGASKDAVDYLARWTVRRMQDRYTVTDTQLDVHAVSKLCEVGKEMSGITDEWLAQNVAPCITAIFGRAVGAILGKSVLWACFDPSVADQVPDGMLQNVTRHMINLNTRAGFNNDEANPIEFREDAASRPPHPQVFLCATPRS